MKQFLEDLKKMIAEKGTEWDAPWKQVPRKYQKDFKSWVGQYMQQSFEGYWHRGWEMYHRKYIVFLLDQKIEEL